MKPGDLCVMNMKVLNPMNSFQTTTQSFITIQSFMCIFLSRRHGSIESDVSVARVVFPDGSVKEVLESKLKKVK